jgi:putative ABC transport system permease protein
MNFWRSLQQAFGNLRANKLRSALTMLGVIIGVSAVIILVSIIEGARSRVVSEFEQLGSKLILIVYNPWEEQARDSPQRLDGMTMADVAAIRDRCNLVSRLSAEMSPGGEETARFGERESRVRPNGVMPDFAALRNLTVARGRFLSDDDIDHWGKVCVIGDKVRRELFRGEDPLGKNVDVAGVSLLVVGTLAPKGKTFDQDNDTVVLMPITTVQKRYVGNDLVSMIYAQPRADAPVNAAMDQVWECLMRRHNNAPGFRVDSQENILNAVGRIMSIFGLVAGSVAGLSLLVGGIGIMNIMLVSVTERTREIGIRKAVGAKRHDILLQFLIESATVSGVGGLIGIGLGAGTAYLVSWVSAKMMKEGMMGGAGIPAHLPLSAVIGAFVFSACVGVFFGIYPAVRAARLSPIDALRHE